MNALLVIDMLKDFLTPKGTLYCGDKTLEIIPFIAKKINEHRENGDKIIYVCDSHTQDDKEFKMFTPHCVKGTEGAKIIDEVRPKPDDIIIEKRRYSAFYGTELGAVLKKLNPQVIHVVGVCTSICVMDTVGDLRNRDYEVVVYKDGVADFDKEAHDFALKRIGKVYGVKVV